MAKKRAKSPVDQRLNVLGDPQRLKQLLKLVEALPETVTELAGTQHLAFKIRKKTFAWYLDSHHGDGIVCVCAKNTLARQAELITAGPKRFFSPQYVGHSGWIGLRLDLPEVDWNEVGALLMEGYRLQAPKRLIEEL